MIPGRSILVNINIHVDQFSLMSVFLHKRMKTHLLDISSILFEVIKTI